MGRGVSLRGVEATDVTTSRTGSRCHRVSARVLVVLAAVFAAGVAVPTAAVAYGQSPAVAVCDVVGTLQVGPPVRDPGYDWIHTREWQIDGRGRCLDGLREWTVTLHGSIRVEYSDGTPSSNRDSVGVCGAVPLAHVSSSPTGISGERVDASWRMPVQVELSSGHDSIAVDQEWVAAPSTLVGPNPFTIDGGGGGTGVLTTRIFASCDGDPAMRSELSFPL